MGEESGLEVYGEFKTMSLEAVFFGGEGALVDDVFVDLDFDEASLAGVELGESYLLGL